MSYDGMKLIRFDGEPHWLMSDGSFVSAGEDSNDPSAPGMLYVKDKQRNVPRLIVN